MEAEPENLNLLSLLGYSYFLNRQFTASEKYYNRILEIDSNHATAVYYLGKINILKGNNKEALRKFTKLVNLKHGVPAYYKQLAILWNVSGNSDSATYYYNLTYQLNPNDADVVVALAYFWLDKQQFEKADSLLDLALAQDSFQAPIIIAKIRSNYSQKKFGAIPELSKLLRKMNSIELNPFTFTAIAYYHLKEYDSCIAISELLKAHQLLSRNMFYLEALAHKELKNYKQAISLLDTCIDMALEPDANDYLSQKGSVLELMSQPKQALLQYDYAYSIFNDPNQLYNIALIYDNAFKDYDKALKYYRSFIKKTTVKTPLKYAIDKELVDFVTKRIQQLEVWKRQNKK